MDELPAYYAERALERLRHPQSARNLKQILKLLEIDLGEPEPAPDFDGLARAALKENRHEQSRDALVFSGELAILGVKVPMAFRLTYVGEFGQPEEIYDDFSYVSHLEVLSWNVDARTPDWKEFPSGAFDSLPMREALTDLVLEHEREKQLKT
jgi:hypothetical protein